MYPPHAVMRAPVPSVGKDIDPERFRQEYYLRRRPVVVRGVASEWPARQSWTLEGLKARIADAPTAVERQPLWWDVDAELVRQDIELPAIVSHLLARQRPTRRPRYTRVWTNPKGHVTPWHYDGNSLDVFNVQVTGHKRFTLVSPETPIDCAPFSLLGRQPLAQPDALLSARHERLELELEAGDMLFLPRHWFHYVESLGDENTNLNWVWTDLSSGPLQPRGTAREHELLALLAPLFRAQTSLRRAGVRLGPTTVAQFNEAYVRDYGGEEDYAVADRLGQRISKRRLLRRAVQELTAPKGVPFPAT